MPYIDQDSREEFELMALEAVDLIEFGITPGELNYLITKACDAYLMYKGKNYTHINDVIGVLECAKLEFYRRIAIPYEDEKIEQNGDVYTTSEE